MAAFKNRLNFPLGEAGLLDNIEKSQNPTKNTQKKAPKHSKEKTPIKRNRKEKAAKNVQKSIAVPAALVIEMEKKRPFFLKKSAFFKHLVILANDNKGLKKMLAKHLKGETAISKRVVLSKKKGTETFTLTAPPAVMDNIASLSVGPLSPTNVILFMIMVGLELYDDQDPWS